MSFFGFDTSGPPRGGNVEPESYDFQETYEGLGDVGDNFNDETFGNPADVGRFAPLPSAPAPVPQGGQISYARAAASNDDEFMQDLWGSSNAPSQPAEQSSIQEKKIMSLEEIEAQLTSIDQAQHHLQQQQQPQFHPFGMPGMIPPMQYGGYMIPPNGFMPPPGQYGQFHNGPIPQHGPISQQPVPLPNQAPLQQQVPHPQHQPIPQQQQQQPPQPQQAPVPVPVQVQEQPQQQQQVAHQQVPKPVATQNIASQQPRPVSKANLSQFPLLGTKSSAGQAVPGHQQSPTSQFNQSQEFREQRESYSQNQNYNYNHNHNHSHHQQHHHHHSNQQDLTPEQQEKIARRQEKVARIMKYSGIMNPKDKDFVTRFQLSQIVTEDPYNEDFYAQVHKVIHPKANHSQESEQQHNSIAQAYLEQSGHRLGGRYKRADVALQRMQQQVQKAVTVAKERPKLTQYAREGALGKISIGTGKKPRQQLEIISKAAQREIEKQEAAKREAGEDNLSPAKKDRSPSISAPTKPTNRYSSKDIMSILENIITELMKVESDSRDTSGVGTSKLWDSLRVLEQPSSSGDDEAEVNPFIQCLNYNKALKILPRLFKFLSREQILTIATLIMSNLENLIVIKNGSYTTYESKKVPESVLKLVEAYSLTFSKVLMNAVLDFKFNEIIGLLVILIEHNNVAFVSTTKIGLSILTTLLSRAELIIGEGSISATDLSEWSSCYDELFTAIESRIAAIFPPHPEDVDDGSSRENYVWQFLATLSLGGKLSHQRIIVDEVRDEIFGVMSRAKAIENSDLANLYKKQNLLNNLNMYLVVMGLVADENEIKELQN